MVRRLNLGESTPRVARALSSCCMNLVRFTYPLIPEWSPSALWCSGQ
ncbi:Protein of unknown function [Pyronema omphalodes CBS 100304]|uniref:Uncharacterized protein n=1 Tax=Pyronema omphalodes (strain CBS 100304) TaxID=1076935 RepID=U4L214_PYROM|nr:Protein of unknown function [Pyronema omphalodes CBS 100304]